MDDAAQVEKLNRERINELEDEVEKLRASKGRLSKHLYDANERVRAAKQLASHHETRHDDARKLMRAAERQRDELVLTLRRLRAKWREQKATRRDLAASATGAGYNYHMGAVETLDACIADIEEALSA